MRPAVRQIILGNTPWTPRGLGSQLIAWWTADRGDLITLSGSQVTSWKDVKGGYDAVQAVSGSRPLFSATSFNGAPGVTYDGVDDELTCTDAALLAALPSGAAASEVWAIIQQDAAAADVTGRYCATFGNAAVVSRHVRRVVSGGVNRAQIASGDGASAITLTGSTVDLSTRHLIRSVTTATGIKLSVDGNALSGETAVVSATSNSRLRLGASSASSAGNFWNGKIRDVVVLNASPSAANVALLNAWGLARRML